MKKILLLLLMLGFVFSGVMAQSGKKSHYLKPTNFQKKVTTLISGKSRSYYSLDAEQPSVINLVGPGKLRVITRGRFIPKEGDKIAYEILYTVDGGEKVNVRFRGVERSKNATYKNGSLGVPGRSEDFEIELGRGNHTVEFTLVGNEISVAARYGLTPNKEKKKDWIAFCPMLPSEPVDLISREETINYYRFSMEKPLKVEINGPTELRVLTRIENHNHMRGRIHYRLQVKENDEIINTYQLSSRRSEITVYKNDNELIPGKGCEFVIDVPKGRHIYEILPLDKDKSTVLGRILLPKKDVKLEK